MKKRVYFCGTSFLCLVALLLFTAVQALVNPGRSLINGGPRHVVYTGPQHYRSRSIMRKPSSTIQATPADFDKNLIVQDKYKFRIRELFWVTPEALNIEVLISRGRNIKRKMERRYSGLGGLFRRIFQIITFRGDEVVTLKKPPILFVHGSFHSAWCFSENYMEYFSSEGHDCYAISLRGTSATSMPPEDPGDVVKIEDHVYDVSFVLDVIRKFYADEGLDDIPPPVIIAHSFGGMIVMKLLENQAIRERLSGVALLCSVPPSGNGPMTQRFMVRDMWAAMKIVWGFVFKGATFSPPSCRELFFDESVSKEDINSYMKRFKADSRVGLDLISLASQLPSKVSMAPSGIADWIAKAGSNVVKRDAIAGGEEFILELPAVSSATTATSTTATTATFLDGKDESPILNATEEREDVIDADIIDIPAVEQSKSKCEKKGKKEKLLKQQQQKEQQKQQQQQQKQSKKQKQQKRQTRRKAVSAAPEEEEEEEEEEGGGGSGGSGASSGNNDSNRMSYPRIGVGKSTVNGVYLPGRLVVGAENDFIVDYEGVQETARYLGLGLDSPSASLFGHTIASSSSVELRNSKVSSTANPGANFTTLAPGASASAGAGAGAGLTNSTEINTVGLSANDSPATTPPTTPESRKEAIAAAAEEFEAEVDAGGFERGAEFEYDTSAASITIDESSGAVILKNLYHDVMLGPKWKRSAAVISQWLNEL